MKRFILSLAIMIMTLTSVNSFAQPRHAAEPGENFMEFQIQLLIKQLQIEESKADDFKALYSEYTQKSEELRPRGQQRGSNRGAAPSEAEIEAQIIESFDMTEKTTALKREYYYKFKEILSANQILSMYNVERRVRERLVTESNKRMERR